MSSGVRDGMGNEVSCAQVPLLGSMWGPVKRGVLLSSRLQAGVGQNSLGRAAGRSHKSWEPPSSLSLSSQPGQEGGSGDMASEHRAHRPLQEPILPQDPLLLPTHLTKPHQHPNNWGLIPSFPLASMISCEHSWLRESCLPKPQGFEGAEDPLQGKASPGQAS